MQANKPSPSKNKHADPKITRKGMFIIATGEMGVGKTYETIKAVIQYVKTWQNRCAIILDPNQEEAWNPYLKNFENKYDVVEVVNAYKQRAKGKDVPMTKSEKNLQKIALQGGRPWQQRIFVIDVFKKTSAGVKKMNSLELRTTMICILENVRRSLGFFDDINAYIKNFEAMEVESSFKNIRHTAKDVIMHMQSISPLRPIHYESTSKLRIHYDRVSARKIKNKLADHYEIVSIAKKIVERQYRLKDEYPRNSPKWWELASYYVVVDTSDKYISNCTREQFVEACKEYALTNTSVLKEYQRKVFIMENRNISMKETLDWFAEEKIQERMWIG